MNLSAITDDLLIGSMPEPGDYERLRELGVRLIINMRFRRGPEQDPHHEPMQTLWLRSLDNPLFPIPLHKLMRGAQSALETIQRGGRVYSHCAYGRHRSVAMGACILIAQGYDPYSAMDLIKQKRPVADPYAFYIRQRIMKFARQFLPNLPQPSTHP